MKYMVYRTTNNINGKIYIGFHKFVSFDDGYLGSGKLMRRAIEKYGSENFTREVLYVFDTPEEALAKEAELVNENFIKRVDVYNLALGGNPPILVGERNGFFGKKHSQETIDRIQESRRKTIEERGYDRITEWACLLDDEIFYTKGQITTYLNTGPNNIFNICKALFEEGRGEFFDEDFQEIMLEFYEKSKVHREKMKALQRLRAQERFTGVPKTEEHRSKIGQAHKGRKNPWTVISNKDPIKIEKTRQKHLGSKRSEEARENISAAVRLAIDEGRLVNHAIDKKWFHDPVTGESGMFHANEVPNGWKPGNLNTRKKCYYDPETLECKRFKEGEQPTRWLHGNPKLKAKKRARSSKE